MAIFNSYVSHYQRVCQIDDLTVKTVTGMMDWDEGESPAMAAVVSAMFSLVNRIKFLSHIL